MRTYKIDTKIDNEYMSLIRNILKHEKINYIISKNDIRY